MRLLIIAVLLLGGCRAPYMSDVSLMTVAGYQIPPTGTSAPELNTWFDANGFAPGPKVYQAESELRRIPGSPLAYALEADRSWWLSRVQTVRDFCRTEKIVYYKLDDNDGLGRAILTARAQC